MHRDVTVREVMDPEFVAASESDSALATIELLLEEATEPAVVLRGAEPVGVVTDRDVLALTVDEEADPAAASVAEVMTESVPTVAPDRTLAEARDRMTTEGTSWLVVSDGGPPDGLITEHDVLTSSVIGTGADANAGPGDAAARAGAPVASTAATDADGATADAFEDQGICEQCGTLSRDLAAFNGQLLCADCRDI